MYRFCCYILFLANEPLFNPTSDGAWCYIDLTPECQASEAFTSGLISQSQSFYGEWWMYCNQVVPCGSAYCNGNGNSSFNDDLSCSCVCDADSNGDPLWYGETCNIQCTLLSYYFCFDF